MKCNWSFFIGCIAALSFLTFLPFTGHADYYDDLGFDIDWPDSIETTVAALENLFNDARTAENSQLGTSIPMLSMPSQTEWDSKSDTEKVLWLVNEEREARELLPLHSGEPNVISVAQDYATLLLNTNTFDHYEDGGPWDRLSSRDAIASCHDFLGVAENLAALFGGWNLPIERSVYMWMYMDAGSNWGHRRAILWYPYTNNSGIVETEGFLGVGTAVGPYEYNGTNYQNTTIVVMNVFDPCETWDYSSLVVPGDVNGDMKLDLKDVISVLRLLTGNPPTSIHPNADTNGNDVIGLEEAIFILGEMSK